MHVASVMVFEGEAPTLKELVDHVDSRLHLVPRYRQRLAYVPFGQGRPVWTDDPHFNPYYHVRHTALPRPADDRPSSASRGASSPSAWTAPSPCGRSGWSRASPATASPYRQDPPRARGRDLRRGHHHGPVRHRPRTGGAHGTRRALGRRNRCRDQAKLLGEALIERSTVPGEMLRGTRALLRRPRRALSQGTGAIPSIGATDDRRDHGACAARAHSTCEIGPHRRYTFLDVDLAT